MCLRPTKQVSFNPFSNLFSLSVNIQLEVQQGLDLTNGLGQHTLIPKIDTLY